MSDLNLFQSFELKQQQQLIINLAMKQAFHVLQLPQLELAEWLKVEIENNPALEVDLRTEGLKEPLDTLPNPSTQSSYPSKERKELREDLLIATPSLYEHLMQQVPLAFDQQEEIQLAELIIGHLNRKGFLETPLDEIAIHPKMEKVLQTIQTLDPPGIGARSVQESLLIQLRAKHQEHSIAATIITDYFDDLIHNRLKTIAKQIHIPLQRLIEIVTVQIASLELYPGSRFYTEPTIALIPDLFFVHEDGKWSVHVNQSHLPTFRIAPSCVQACQEGLGHTEERYFFRRHLAGAKWLQKIVARRNETLRAIGEYVLEKQARFFNFQEGCLLPLTTREVALELKVHEATIARAVANKYVACPQGLFALRAFFKQGITSSHGRSISNHSLKEMLSVMIAKEDKRAPLSDSQLAEQFRMQGVCCARRTIAKYRSLLNIAPATQRKH